MKKVKIKEIVLYFCFLNAICFADDKQENNIFKYFFNYATKNENYKNNQPIINQNEKDFKIKFFYFAVGTLSSLLLYKKKNFFK